MPLDVGWLVLAVKVQATQNFNEDPSVDIVVDLLDKSFYCQKVSWLVMKATPYTCKG